MRKRSRILLVVLLVAGLGGRAWQVLRPREPNYQGKPLSYWLGKSVGMGAAAVRQTGTNAIPTLLRMLRARDSAFFLRLVALAQRQHVVKIEYTTAAERHRQAMLGFLFLNDGAKEAVPALMEIYEHGVSMSSRADTALALGFVGPVASPAVPLLLPGVNHTNHSIRMASIQALGGIHAEPALVVPVLLKLLGKGDPEVRTKAAEGLRQFGTDAKIAAPILLPFLNDPDLSVRTEATNVLKRIDPDAAAKAGVK
ncbi:MAG: repeat protein [Pedosphaera sp.]|nr:repeat protein [Pedosphaera sp.]